VFIYVVSLLGFISVLGCYFSWLLMFMVVVVLSTPDSLFCECILYFYYYLCGRIMDLDGEIIKAPLGVEFCASTFRLPSTSTSHTDNSTSASCS
jgi:hypothetical protein